MDQKDKEQIVYWMDQAAANLGRESEKTLEYCSRIFSYAESCGEDLDMYLGFAHYYSGEAYYTLNNVEMVLYHISQAIGYLEHAGEWELVARAYNLTGITSMVIGNAPFAMNYYVQALACCRKYGLSVFEQTVLINMGMLYYSHGEYQKANTYFVDSLLFLERHPDISDYYFYFLVDHIGLGRCALHSGDQERAWKYERKIRETCVPQMDIYNYSYLIFQTQLYHASGDVEQRDRCIANIQGSLNHQIRIMDYFEDFYEYAGLLLEIAYHEQFLQLIRLLDELAVHAKVINLQRRIRELKIKYHKKTGDTAAYLQETAKYYEDHMRMERSNRAMMLEMLDICRVLEEEREEKSQIIAQNQQLTEKSETDALTGLPNRYRLRRNSELQFLRAAAAHLPMAVEILDIDYFKQYNDNYGHQKGDSCICMIADQLKRIGQYQGVSVYRYGGDEFVVIYEGLTRDRVAEITEDLRDHVGTEHIEHVYSKSADIVTISQGICWGYPAEGQAPADYLHAADEKLYEVKEQCRGGILLADLSAV